MYSKKIHNELNIPNENNINYEQKINPIINDEGYNQESDLLDNNNDEDPYLNYRYAQKEIFKNDDNNQINNNNIINQIPFGPYKQKYQKIQISNYIYHSERPFTTNNINNNVQYNKYSIRNPVKEKSSNKLKKNKYIYNDLNQYNNRNNKLINNKENNTVKYNEYNNNEEKKTNVKNNTNTNFWTANINNKDIYENNYKGGNIDLYPKKQYYKNYILSKNKQSPKNIHISYIYDYSQEPNDNSYRESVPEPEYIPGPYLKKPKFKKKNKSDFITLNKKNTKQYRDNLKKRIESSRLKFESIRKIEKKIKDYFNLNGLKIENRELYDQSAIMIQSAFRGYYLREKLYEKIYLFVNMKCLLDSLEKIFVKRKMEYFDYFLKNLGNYLNSEKNNVSNDKNSKDIQNFDKEIKEKQIKDINEPLIPHSCITFSFLKKDSEIKKESSVEIDNNNIKNNKDFNLEEKYKELLKENEELKKSNEELKRNNTNLNNIFLNNKNNNNNNLVDNNNKVQNTQESIELKIEDENNNGTEIKDINDTIKKQKLKNLFSIKRCQAKALLHKNFLKFYYIALLSKNTIKTVPMIYTKNIIKSSGNNINEISFREKKNEKIYKKRIKMLKNLILKNDLKMKNSLYNKFIVFYFKGLVAQIQDNNVNKFDNDNGNDNNDINNNMAENNKIEEKIIDIDDDNMNDE